MINDAQELIYLSNIKYTQSKNGFKKNKNAPHKNVETVLGMSVALLCFLMLKICLHSFLCIFFTSSNIHTHITLYIVRPWVGGWHNW
jgi:hypothetical protein